MGSAGAAALPPSAYAYLLLGLDPHVLGPLLAMFAFVGAACLALGRLQPRGPWSHHLHGGHAATAALHKEEQSQSWRWDHTGALGTAGPLRPEAPSPELHTPIQDSGPLSEARVKAFPQGRGQNPSQIPRNSQVRALWFPWVAQGQLVPFWGDRF